MGKSKHMDLHTKRAHIETQTGRSGHVHAQGTHLKNHKCSHTHTIQAQMCLRLASMPWILIPITRLWDSSDGNCVLCISVAPRLNRDWSRTGIQQNFIQLYTDPHTWTWAKAILSCPHHWVQMCSETFFTVLEELRPNCGSKYEGKMGLPPLQSYLRKSVCSHGSKADSHEKKSPQWLLGLSPRWASTPPEGEPSCPLNQEFLCFHSFFKQGVCWFTFGCAGSLLPHTGLL